MGSAALPGRAGQRRTDGLDYRAKIKHHVRGRNFASDRDIRWRSRQEGLPAVGLDAICRCEEVYRMTEAQ